MFFFKIYKDLFYLFILHIKIHPKIVLIKLIFYNFIFFNATKFIFYKPVCFLKIKTIKAFIMLNTLKYMFVF
jgi:hypothetical protein